MLRYIIVSIISLRCALSGYTVFYLTGIFLLTFSFKHSLGNILHKNTILVFLK